MVAVFSGGSPILVNSSALLTASPGRGTVSLYAGSAESYAALYRAQPNVRLVVRFLGRNMAQLPLKSYRRLGDSDRQSIDRNHPLGAWLRTPDSAGTVPVTRHRWIRALVEDLAIYDSFLAVKYRNEATGTLSTIRIPPTNFSILGDSWLWPEGFRVFGNRGHRDYAPEEVIYLAGHNPEDPRVGVSPIEALRRVLAEDYAAGLAREQFWNNSARTSGVLSRPVEAPRWSDEARERFARDWHARWAGNGPDAGGTPILEEGMTFTPASVTAKDAEYLGARRLTREECAAQFFIPPVFVGILENANFSNVREQHRSLYSDTFGPWMDWITTDLEAQLLPEFPDVAPDAYFEFRIEEKLRGSFEEEAAAIQTATGAPWLARNEARAMKDLPPIEGGDDLVVPLNVLVGGQASPRDSAPPPPGLAHRPAHGAKARPRALAGWEEKTAEVLTGFFTRQRSAVLARLGAGAELADAFDLNRWNSELGTDLYALALEVAEDLGASVAGPAGTDFDRSLVEGWLAENARIAAEGVNGATLAALGEAYAGVRVGTASRSAKRDLRRALEDAGLDFDDDDGAVDDLVSNVDPARSVFDYALAARVAQIATSRTTTVSSFARTEGARQAGLRTKTWVSSGSPNSRHSALDGETVPLGDTFSNGAAWPGDPVLGVDETAGCLCSVDFGV